MSLKKNILIFAIPTYAALDLYLDKISKYGLNYNFYFLLDNRGLSKQTFKQLEILKSKELIKDFFILPMVEDKFFFKNFSQIKLFKFTKIIYRKIENIKFDVIITSSNIETSANYIIQKIKRKHNPVLIGLPVHNFKVSNELIDNWNQRFKFKNLIKVRTNFNLIINFFNIIITKIISLFIFRDLTILKINNENYPIYCDNLNFFISSNQSELFLYSRKYKNLKTLYLQNDNYCKCEVKKKNNLLVIPKVYLKNKKIMDILVNEYVNNIIQLARVYNFDEIDIKPHPRDDSENCIRIKKDLLKHDYKVNILDKNLQFENYCEYLAIMGVASTMLVNALNKCDKILSFGMLKLGQWTHKNPTPKYLVGEYEGFKSGIIWIDEIKNIEKLNKKDLFLYSESLRNKKSKLISDSITFEQMINL